MDGYSKKQNGYSKIIVIMETAEIETLRLVVGKTRFDCLKKEYLIKERKVQNIKKGK